MALKPNLGDYVGQTLREREEAPPRPREGRMQGGMGNIKEPSELLCTWLGRSGLRRG